MRKCHVIASTVIFACLILVLLADALRLHPTGPVLVLMAAAMVLYLLFAVVIVAQQAMSSVDLAGARRLLRTFLASSVSVAALCAAAIVWK